MFVGSVNVDIFKEFAFEVETDLNWLLSIALVCAMMCHQLCGI